MTPTSLRGEMASWKNRAPISTPMRGAVALKMAEYPAGNRRAAKVYIRKGMPELMAPSNRVCRNLPWNCQRVRSTIRMTISPREANSTRKKAVGTAPSTGATMRMNRKLKPQMAPSSRSRA